jgi:ABC-type multidrug transport system fused ATPase/permease subunit
MTTAPKEDMADKPVLAHRWTNVAWIVVALAAACALAVLLAGPGYRFGILGLGAGIQAIRWAATVAAVVLFVALVGTLMARHRGMKQASTLFIVAVVISLLTSAPPALLWYRGKSLPRIHDVSTDMKIRPATLRSCPCAREHAIRLNTPPPSPHNSSRATRISYRSCLSFQPIKPFNAPSGLHGRWGGISSPLNQASFALKRRQHHSYLGSRMTLSSASNLRAMAVRSTCVHCR